MKAQKKQLTIISFLLLVLCLTGCRTSSVPLEQATVELQNEEDMETIQKQLDRFEGEEAYELEFEKPHVEPKIYIDKNGYDIFDTKSAYFVGEELESEFSIYNEEDGSIVYRGKMIRVAKDPITEKSVYKGDFSEVKTPGVFYVQTAIIGRSYSFSIEREHDKAILKIISDQYLKQKPDEYFAKGNRNEMKEPLYGMLQICIAKQLCETSYDEKMTEKLSEYAKWLLEWLKEAEKESLHFSVEENLLLSTVFSQTAEALSESNDQLSDSCQVQAKICYDQAKLLSDSSDVYHTAEGMAAASLYKTTGNAGYHNVIKAIHKEHRQRKQQESNETNAGTDDSDKKQLSENTIQKDDMCMEDVYQNFLAAYYYMTTEKSEDITICEDMMSEFMNDCTGYLDHSASAAFGLTREITEEETIETQILYDATQLAVADYIVVSREYRNVCRQQMHYLLHDRGIEELDAGKLAALWLIMSIISR